jgi:two-component system, chemotaxis family, protein-glutamate methylesterase/glutaminase
MSVADPSLRPRSKPAGHDPIRVMIVDDAIVVRGLLVRWIEAEVGLQVVASLRGGREAVAQVERTNPDVVILDVDMPDIDGITALPLLFEKRRDLVVIMSSTLTRHNAEVSLKALSLGAADYIPKPESTRELTNSAAFRRDLIEKIRVLGARRRQRLGSARAGFLGRFPRRGTDRSAIVRCPPACVRSSAPTWRRPPTASASSCGRYRRRRRAFC